MTGMMGRLHFHINAISQRRDDIYYSSQNQRNLSNLDSLAEACKYFLDTGTLENAILGCMDISPAQILTEC